MKPDDDCARIDALLPWFVNRSLDDVERRDVERHLAGCARCRAELPLLARLEKLLSVPGTSRAEGAFDGVLARIDMHRQRTHHRRFALAAAVMLALAATLGLALQQQYFAPRYHTVTDTVPATGNVVLLDLAFAPQTRLASLRGVLEDYDAVIVGGPDERGHVRLQFALPSTRDADTLLQRLRADARVVAAHPASAGKQP